MTESRDRREFGTAVKQTRQRLGLSQQDIVDRVSGYYGDVSAYRRVENGSRFPSRDAAIAILVHGLKLTELAKIDTLLAVAGYEALNVTEITDLGLTPEIAASVSSPPERSTSTERRSEPSREVLAAIAAVCAAVAASAWICANAESGRWLGLSISGMYAGLYVISLLLETAYEPEARRLSVLTGIFCLMLVSSSAALAVDARLVNSGASYGSTVAIAILAVAAITQVVLSRHTLPDYPVAKGRHQMHTARSAHLKNTCYFLLIVFLFWLPPLHAIGILRREMRAGHGAVVRETLQHWALVSHGMITLNYGWLIGLLIAMVAISLPMGSQLLDNLRPHASHDSYIHLFYFRAILYFALSGTCVVWYASSVGSLLDQVH